MKCEAICPPTTYHFRDKPCEKNRGIKNHHWHSPTGTKARKLCAHHRAVVDRHGDIKTRRDQ